MKRQWIIAAAASIALNGLMIALALYPSAATTRLVDRVLMPGDSVAHYLGFRGGGENILPMLAASAVVYFLAFWICLRVLDYVRHRSATARQ